MDRSTRPGGLSRRGVSFWSGPARRSCQAVYIAAFGVATFNHAQVLIVGGWLPYRGVSLWINAYWTSLTVLDALAIVLLVFRPRWGLGLAILIMISDVAVNGYVASMGLPGQFWSPALAMQATFLVFVLLTARWLMKTGPSAELIPPR